LFNNAPLIAVCAAECNIGLLSLLLEFNADINTENENGDSALHIASELGHLQIVQFLVKKGARVSKLNNRQECPMAKAIPTQQADVISYFLSYDWTAEKDLNISKDEATFNCLILASRLGLESVTQMFLENYKMINVPERISGDTPLTAACKNNQLSTVELLLNNGANPNATDESFTPPLIWAARGGNHSIMNALIKNGANVNGFDEQKRTALIAAARSDDVLAAEVLVRYDSSLDWGDKDGISALGWACIRANLNICKYLLQLSCEINKPDVLGRTPLHLAAFSGDEEIIQVSHVVNTVTKFIVHLLHYNKGCYLSDINLSLLVKLLLEKGAQMETTDRKGIRPLDRAIACNNANVAQLFLRKGAKLGATTWTMAAGKPRIMYLANFKMDSLI
jgi:ankyrin repeat protein